MAKKKTPPPSRKAKSTATKKAMVKRKTAPKKANKAPSAIKVKSANGANAKVAKAQSFNMPPVIDVSDGKVRTALITSWFSKLEEQPVEQFNQKPWTVKQYDAEPSIKADYTGHIFKMDAIEDGSIDALWCQQILQRYYIPHVQAALKEFKRVMAEDALLYINVPDGQIASSFIANDQPSHPLYQSAAGPITPVDILYGFQKAILSGKRHMTHHSIFSLKQLGILLRDAGFSDIRVHRRGYVIHASAYKHSAESGKFIERVSLSSDETPENIPNAPKPPSQPAETAPAKRHIDNLADQPAQWKPLGLKKK